MIVKLIDYATEDDSFIKYEVKDMDMDDLVFLNENVNDGSEIVEDSLFIKVSFEGTVHPFCTETAKFDIEASIVTQEIEMGYFLSSLLEDKL